jgi:hypothetical protein
MSTEVFVLLYSLAVWRIVPTFCWALSDKKGMSYLAKKNSLMKQAYKDHKFLFYKKSARPVNTAQIFYFFHFFSSKLLYVPFVLARDHLGKLVMEK